MIGLNEWLLIALAVLLVFGAGAIPKIARALGRAKSEFQKGLKEGQAEGNSDADTKAPREAPTREN
jgi:TatA/E family protein of Tat protein translocase